jgi:hypothetical protein
VGAKSSKEPVKESKRPGLSASESLAQIRSEEERLRQVNVLRAALANALQSNLRALLAKIEFDRLCKLAVRRRHVAQEILTTETSYVDSLTLIHDVFGEELKRCKLADDAQLKVLFPEIVTLIGVNSALRDRLTERLAALSWTTKLGAVFLEAMPTLKAYNQFVNHYPHALALISKRAETDEAFKAALERAQANARCRNNDLASFMIMPVQRVPRYVLLLSDLLGVTPPGHCDHDDVKLAVERMKEIAAAINTSKKNADNAQKLIEIYNILTPTIDDLVAPSRSVLCRGLLTDFSELGKHPNGKLYMIFLFNDRLVKAGQDTDKQGRHTVKLVVDLAGAAVQTLPDSGKLRFAFQLSKPKSGQKPAVALNFSAKSADSMNKWLDLLSRAVADCAARQQSFALKEKSPNKTDALQRVSSSASFASSRQSSSSSTTSTSLIIAPSPLPPSSKLHHANTMAALPVSKTKAPY